MYFATQLFRLEQQTCQTIYIGFNWLFGLPVQAIIILILESLFKFFLLILTALSLLKVGLAGKMVLI